MLADKSLSFGKTRNIFIQSSAAMLQNELHVFVACFMVTLLTKPILI